MGLALTSAVAQPSLATVNLLHANFNFKSGTVDLIVQLVDSNGAQIGDAVTLSVPSGTAATWLSTMKSTIYTRLQSVYGAGTVT